MAQRLIGARAVSPYPMLAPRKADDAAKDAEDLQADTEKRSVYENSERIFIISRVERVE